MNCAQNTSNYWNWSITISHGSQCITFCEMHICKQVAVQAEWDISSQLFPHINNELLIYTSYLLQKCPWILINGKWRNILMWKHIAWVLCIFLQEIILSRKHIKRAMCIFIIWDGDNFHAMYWFYFLVFLCLPAADFSIVLFNKRYTVWWDLNVSRCCTVFKFLLILWIYLTQGGWLNDTFCVAKYFFIAIISLTFGPQRCNILWTYWLYARKRMSSLTLHSGWNQNKGIF